MLMVDEPAASLNTSWLIVALSHVDQNAANEAPSADAGFCNIQMRKK